MNGWIQLHRQLLDHPLWTCEPFTRGQAWVDLLLLANHKDSFFYKRNIKISVKRGQLARSEVELADRWSWSRSKVRKFINDLEKEQQVIQQKSNVTQLVTIIKYEDYQKKEQQGIHQQDTNRTPAGHQQDTYNNDNNIKNEEEVKKIYIEKTDKFLNDVNEIWNKKGGERYMPLETLKKFYSHWSEPFVKGRNKGLPKFLGQDTWSLSGRLATWRSNAIKYGEMGEYSEGRNNA